MAVKTSDKVSDCLEPCTQSKHTKHATLTPRTHTHTLSLFLSQSISAFGPNNSTVELNFPTEHGKVRKTFEDEA